MSSIISSPSASRLAPALLHASASLTRKHIDIWRLNLADLQRHETALRALLNRCEEASISSRPRALSRAALRFLLGAYLECSPERVCLQTGAHGKPSLDDTSRQGNARDIRFNLSHSGNVALVAVALECELGVDVERLRPVPRCLQIARRYFSSRHHLQLQSAALEEMDECFLRLWSHHEAMKKLSGFGMHLLGAKPRISRTEISIREVQDISWREQNGDFYFAALAKEAGVHQSRYWTLP